MKDQPKGGEFVLFCYVYFSIHYHFENDNVWFDIKSKQAQLKTAGLLS